MPIEWRLCLERNEPVANLCSYDVILLGVELSKKFYRILTTEDNLLLHKNQAWERELNVTWPYIEYVNAIRDMYAITNVCKLRSFHYRLLCRALILNTHLKRYRMRDNNLCTFCGKETETLSHLFIFCDVIKDFWIGFENFAYNFSDEQINFNELSVVASKVVDQTNNIKNFLCLLAKQHIYSQKCQGKLPNLAGFKARVNQVQVLEKYIATKNDSIHKHYHKWFPKGAEIEANQPLNDYALQYVNDL